MTPMTALPLGVEPTNGPTLFRRKRHENPMNPESLLAKIYPVGTVLHNAGRISFPLTVHMGILEFSDHGWERWMVVPSVA